jgi:pilus assembly protein Flp/PilA
MKRFPGSEPGQGLVEYALLLVLVTVVVIITLILLGPSLEDFISGAINLLSG